MKLHDLIVESARAGINLIRDDGTIEPGHNGLKKDPETSVRVNSHWSMIFLFAYNKTGEEPFRDAALKCLEYLFSKEARPHDQTFWVRKNPKKDKCNGVMGQAFALDALSFAYKSTKILKYNELATKVFELHPFEIKAGLWKKVEIDGKKGYFDLTLNHQLWFASASCAIKNSLVQNRIKMFLDKLDQNMRVHENGLIVHEIFATTTIKQKITTPLSKAYLFLKQQKSKREQREKLYHFYNLYALAILKEKFPEHPFWQSSVMQKALDFAKNKTYDTELFENKIYWSAPLGFEVAYVLQTFFEEEFSTRTCKWITKEVSMHYDPTSHFLNKCVLDTNTVQARLYEAVRLQNYSFNES